MNLSDRIIAFQKLGIVCRNLTINSSHLIFKKIERENEYFTKENVIQSLISISHFLTTSKLEEWVKNYDLSLCSESKKVGVFLAGNIPLVGFHDFLCVLILNHKFVAKFSSKDTILFTYLIEELCIIEPRFKSKIILQSNIYDSDIFICTGNDLTAKYLDFMLKSKPRLIRASKSSVAILDGNETEEYIQLLMKDMFLYFGLGCRSVSKLFIPRSYDIHLMKTFFSEISHFLNHEFYLDNYRYYKSLYNLSNKNFIDFESLLLLESKELFSPISVVYYEFYDKITEISMDFNKIQCVVSNNNIFNSVPFGEAQRPGLFDYADNIDTINFLLKN